MKIVVWILSAVAGILIILLSLVYFMPGYDMNIVLSDSMKPVFSAGDLVITVPPGGIFGKEIEPSSIVLYDNGNELIIHRVVSVDGNILVTKGDANEEPDPRLVETHQVKGIYLFGLPRLGYFKMFIETRLGWFLVIIVPAALLLGLIVKDIIKEALGSGKPKTSGPEIRKEKQKTV